MRTGESSLDLLGKFSFRAGLFFHAELSAGKMLSAGYSTFIEAIFALEEVVPTIAYVPAESA